MYKSYIWTLAFFLAVSCGGNKEQQQHDDKPAKVAAPAKEEKVDEDLLKGNLELTIDGETYQLTEFDRRRSEITWMDDNRISVRLNSLDREKRIQLLISGEDAYGEKPLEISLDAADFEKTNHGGLTFTGFVGDADNLSTTRFLEGKGMVSELDPTSLNFKMNFEGRGLHSEIGSQNDTVTISGSLSVQLDNVMDTRRKE